MNITMKSTLLILTLLLAACGGSTSKYLLATATIATTLEAAEDRHERLVSTLSSYKETFSEEEQEILKLQLERLDFIKLEIDALKDSTTGKLLLSSSLSRYYAEVRDAYGVLIDIVGSHLDEFPIIVKYDIKSQERDAKILDNAIASILSDREIEEEGVNNILAVIKMATQIAVATL